jgi:uncharacterized protein YkwD
MQSQVLASFGLLIASFVCCASVSEAGIFGRRQASYQPTYTYRPAATQVSRPASATAAQPAAAPQASSDKSEQSASAQADDAQSKPKSEQSSTTAQQNQQQSNFHPTILGMLFRNNSIRTSRGMRPMSLSARLTAAAQNHANYMARTGSFSHYSNGGPQGRVNAYGFRGGVRENIAMGQPSVDSAFSTWTASGAHYANMMSHSDVAGFGYAVGSNGQAYWVAVYGTNDGGN